MPWRPGRYRLSLALAAADALAGLGDRQALRQGVDIDVCGGAAIGEHGKVFNPKSIASMLGQIAS
jgi:hypothetical protein